MAASKANGGGAGPKDNKGKNDTIVRVTGAVIVTGVAYGLYKYFAGDSDTPLGQRSKMSTEPFHEQISLEKPEAYEQFENRVKGAAGTLKEKAGEFKGAIEDKGRGISRAVKGKGQEVKEWTADKGERVKDGTANLLNRKGDEATSDADDATNYVAQKAEDTKNTIADKAGDAKDFVADKVGKTKETGTGWFGRGSSEANKGKEEAKKFASDKDRKANDAYDRAKAEANREEDAKRYAGDKERQFKDAGSGFLDKVGSEANREKEALKRLGYDAEQKVEQAGSNVAHKASDLAHKVLPGKGQYKSGWSKSSGRGGAGGEYGIVKGDTLWSISRRFGVTIGELKAANGIRDADFIVAGDIITIPN